MYNFIYPSSNAYTPYCLTSMSSLLKNNRELKECCFYVLSNDISSVMKHKMETLCESFEAELHIVECDSIIREIFEREWKTKFQSIVFFENLYSIDFAKA